MKRALQYLEHFEPARLRAIYAAVVALAVSLGLGQYVAGFDPTVQSVLSAAVVLLPIIQGELTRHTVYAPATVEAHLVEGAYNVTALPHAGGHDADVPVGDDDGPTTDA